MTSRSEPLTHGPWNAQLLYFTGPSLTSDGASLVILGDRERPARGPYDPDAALDVYLVDVATGAAERLTRNRDGVARAYVTFGGHRDRGIAPGSVAFSPTVGRVVLVHGRAIICVAIEGGSTETLLELPAGVVTGYGALSDDGTRYAVPVIDAAAFGDLHAIDATVRRLGLSSRILVVDTGGAGMLDEIVVPAGWVTHVQLRPGDRSTVLFNHEWAAHSGVRRIWLRDRSGLRALRAPRPGSGDPMDDRPGDGAAEVPIDAADDVEHEAWTSDGSAVVYHGVSRRPGPDAGRAFVGRLTIPDGMGTELFLPPGPAAYGHVSALDERTLVTDGIADPIDAVAEAGAPGALGGIRAERTGAGAVPRRLDNVDAPAEDGGGRWITRIDVDWAARRVKTTPLTEHGSSWASQDAHPHPVFTPDGRWVLFTTDRDGVRAVHRVTAGPR